MCLEIPNTNEYISKIGAVWQLKDPLLRAVKPVLHALYEENVL